MHKNERQMLELAAKASRIEDEFVEDGRPFLEREIWNPLEDNGDAMHLARVLNLRIDFNFRTGADKRLGVGVWTPSDTASYPAFWTMYGRDPDRDARCTIVRAAAFIGSAA